jgi:hypothetical protein
MSEIMTGVVSVAVGVMLAVLLLALGVAYAMRRAFTRAIAANPHLTRLGRHFQRDYDTPKVLAVDVDEVGQLHLQLAWAGEHIVELDADEYPDEGWQAAAGTTTWTLPPQQVSDAERATLLALPTTSIQLTDHGVIAVNGPLVTDRSLTADNGVTVKVAMSPLVAL